jgi:hypothetical protein
MNMHQTPRHGSEGVSATPLPLGRPTTTFGGGRICSADGCTTRLSLYNPGAKCSVHHHSPY